MTNSSSPTSPTETRTKIAMRRERKVLAHYMYERQSQSVEHLTTIIMFLPLTMFDVQIQLCGSQGQVNI